MTVEFITHPVPSEKRAAKRRPRPESQAPVAAMPFPQVRRPWYLKCKLVADVVAALLLMVVAAPIILVSALLVKLTSRGPAFYTQTRLGLHGRTFTMYKLRTMIHNCERLTGPRWAVPGDPRVTWFGRFLRATHLDELPQLLNVLRGQMSLIGPRPERPEFIPELERAMPHYRGRLLVRPGVTGLAQVQIPADTDLDTVRRKLAYDFYYVRHVGFWLDLRLLLCTAFYALRIPFRIPRKLLGIPSGREVEQATPPRVGQPAANVPTQKAA